MRTSDLRLVEQPWLPWLLLFFLVTAATASFDLTGTSLGQAFAPALLSTIGHDSGVFAQLLVGAVVGGAFVVNALLVRLFPFKTQVIVVWGELLVFFLLFFDSFGLSYDYIAERGPILVGLELSKDGFLQGAALTIYVCIVSIIISTVIALAAALARLSSNGLAFAVATFYISFFRGTPLLLQVMLIYLGLPQLGLVLEAIPSGIIALSLCYGAYMAEIFRAGIQSIPAGQHEAARALGLRPGVTMRKIILPQAMRLIVPPTGNQFIAMLKDSSLVSVMGVWELMYLARSHGRAEFRYVEMLITAAIIYWIISFVFELIQARIEAYYGKSEIR
jgi:polar amino acid transport system permease protein